jgi:hypothetical protein
VRELERASRLLRGLGASRYDATVSALSADLGIPLPT